MASSSVMGRGSLALAALAAALAPGQHGAAGSAAVSAPASYEPAAWWRFENASDIGLDSSSFGRHLGQGAKQDREHWPTPEKAGGPVGGYITFGSDADAPGQFTKSRGWGANFKGGLPESPGMTIEFLLKPNPGFLRGGHAEPLPGLQIGVQEIMWYAMVDSSERRELSVPLSGAGVLAADYLWGAPGKYDGWHHVAASLDAASGRTALWIDGESQPAMQAKLNSSASIAAIKIFTIDKLNAVALYACLDEIAVFSQALPDSLIYQHFQDTMAHHRPYSAADPGGTAPAPPVHPDANSSDFYDLKDFPPGTELPSPAGLNNTNSVDATCVDQLHAVPSPRFNRSSVSKYYTPYNFNWMDPHYMAGSSDVDPAIRLNNTNMTLDLQHTLADKFRYGLLLQGLRLSTSAKGFTPTAIDNVTFALANLHPEIPFNTICPFGAIFRNSTKPGGCYLQNAAGQFIGVTGVVVAEGGRKSIRPMSQKMAEAEGCPDSIWAAEGEKIRDHGFKPLASYLTRPMNVVNLDGEVFVDVDHPAEDYNFSHDPKVVADFKASGLANWLTYWSTWRVRLTHAATDPYMTDPDLRGEGGVLKGAYLTMYQVQGTDNYFGNWSQTREIGSPMPSGLNRSAAMRYSTTDMYLEGPHMWWQCSGSNHALCWVDKSRQSELQSGDALFSPYVAAGWSGKAEHNTRPAQWLGLLKIVAAWGAEWFYTGFFNVHEDSHARMPPSSQWCWQGMAPSYAQAAFSQVAPFTYEGALVFADANTTFAMKTNAKTYTFSPLLWAGQPNIIAVARRFGDAFLITLATQKNSNAALNLAQINATATIRVPGLTAPAAGNALTLTARLQGSVYVYRDDTDGAPVLYQVDSWHEATHPLYWKADAALLEAELFSGHLSPRGASVMRTLRAQNSSAGDFRGFRTFVDLSAAERLGVIVSFPLSEHGITATSGRSIRVRVLARGPAPAANGVRFVPELSVAAAGVEPVSEYQGWAWHSATVAGPVISLAGTSWVDQLQVEKL